jgi:hypothetical protein
MTLPQSAVMPCETHFVSVRPSVRKVRTSLVIWSLLSISCRHHGTPHFLQYLEFFFPVVFRPDSGSWPPLTGFANPLRPTSLGRTPLDEWSARRRVLHLTTHNTHNRQTSMLPERFEPAVPASKWQQTHALNRTGICQYLQTTSRFQYITSGVYIFSINLEVTSKI